jgi:hypothetical protein
VAGWAAVVVSATPPAHAASLLVDDFAAPSAPDISVFVALGERTLRSFDGSILGGVRDTFHHVYTNPSNSVAALAVGDGQVSSSSGVGVRTEVLLLWGAFTRPTGDPSVGGPLLAVDARPYAAFELTFGAASAMLNINIVLYTSQPLDPANPLHYTTVGNNFSPAVPGGPMTVTMPFSGAPNFNFGRVDGVVVEIDRANANTGQAWNLDRFSLATAPVPEPGAMAMLLAGLAVVGLLARTRRR